MVNQHVKPLHKLKRMLGLFLFWLSWLLWVLVLLMPFVLDAELATITIVSTSLLVAAEISFVVSLLLLGRPFYLAIKQRVTVLWRKICGRKSAP